MTEVDQWVVEKVIPYREEILEIIKQKHPFIIEMGEKVLGTMESYFGMQVFENGAFAGQYTFQMKGVHVVHTEVGKLEPRFKVPITGAVIKPYVIVEKSVLERFLKDESLKSDLFKAMPAYLPEMTIKFLK